MSDRAIKATVNTFLALVLAGLIWHTFWSPYGDLKSGLTMLGAGLIGGYAGPIYRRFRRRLTSENT